ncbi:MAG: hypothetical protein K8L91_33190 [Anaerolineae bacterium]|nr:hypothetical protein [Anaerolineae bacterium]
MVPDKCPICNGKGYLGKDTVGVTELIAGDMGAKCVLCSGTGHFLKGTTLEEWIRGAEGYNISEEHGHYHVSLYHKKGGHVSADIHSDGTSTDVHGTLTAYEADGRRPKGKLIIKDI